MTTSRAGKRNFTRFPLNGILEKKARMLDLAGDPTRIRILCFMFRYRKACVSDIAGSLGMSIASVSHHLLIMRDNGFFTAERAGQNVCYELVENADSEHLEKIVCGGAAPSKGKKQ